MVEWAWSLQWHGIDGSKPHLQAARRARPDPGPPSLSFITWEMGRMVAGRIDVSKQSLKHCTHTSLTAVRLLSTYRLTATRAPVTGAKAPTKPTLHGQQETRTLGVRNSPAASEPQGRVRPKLWGCSPPFAGLWGGPGPQHLPSYKARQAGASGDQCEPRSPLLALSGSTQQKVSQEEARGGTRAASLGSGGEAGSQLRPHQRTTARPWRFQVPAWESWGVEKSSLTDFSLLLALLVKHPLRTQPARIHLTQRSTAQAGGHESRTRLQTSLMKAGIVPYSLSVMN